MLQLPSRRVPVALKEPLKQELDRLSNIGVIQRVDTPTEWISAIVVTTKKNGKVGLCIDPKPLNQALHRNHYPLPTIDDVLPLLSKARVFKVLNTKNGFWHIQLDEASSLATTFVTPLGKISLAANAIWILSSSVRISEVNWCGTWRATTAEGYSWWHPRFWIRGHRLGGLWRSRP